MVAKKIVIGIVLGAGVGAIAYGLAMQKKEPRTSSTIFTIIGTTAGLLAISSALIKDRPTIGIAGSVVSGLGSMASALR